MQITKKGKIILNLTLTIPDKKIKLDENTIVGVDLGQAIPAVCAVNNDDYKRCFIGSADDFLRQRTQLQAQRSRLQKALRNISGGHGTKKKLQGLERLKLKESNFVNSYCHMVSYQVVDFAVKQKAKYINLENLKGFGDDKEDDKRKLILRNWSYYKMQQQIIYKAAQYGIIVRKINPKFTSQTCSYCGELGNRKTQKEFYCLNPECKCHKMYARNGYINADYNAARNIALSTQFAEDENG